MTFVRHFEVLLEYLLTDQRIAFFLASNVSHIASDVLAAPRAEFADGYADVMMIRKTSKSDLMKFLLDFGTDGVHINHPMLEYVKAKALVLRAAPLQGSVLLGVDGEKISPTTELQVEVHKALMNVFAAPHFC